MQSTLLSGPCNQTLGEPDLVEGVGPVLQKSGHCEDQLCLSPKEGDWVLLPSIAQKASAWIRYYESPADFVPVRPPQTALCKSPPQHSPSLCHLPSKLPKNDMYFLLHTVVCVTKMPALTFVTARHPALPKPSSVHSFQLLLNHYFLVA